MGSPDERMRDLERRAVQGDPAAAEALHAEQARARGPQDELVRLGSLVPAIFPSDPYVETALTGVVHGNYSLRGERALGAVLEMVVQDRQRTEARLTVAISCLRDIAREDVRWSDAIGDMLVEILSTKHSPEPRGSSIYRDVRSDMERLDREIWPPHHDDDRREGDCG